MQSLRKLINSILTQRHPIKSRKSPYSTPARSTPASRCRSLFRHKITNSNQHQRHLFYFYSSTVIDLKDIQTTQDNMKFPLCTLLSTFLSSGTVAFLSIQQPQQRVQSHLLATRESFITGNWKLNPQTKQEALDLAQGIADSVDSKSPGDVGLFVPFPYIESVKNVVGDKAIIGAQCVTPEMKGAFTGGVSPAMLKSMGVEWSLAGHSERREIFKESDEFINAQCQMLVDNDMKVILCIGESLEEFEKSLVGDICEVQLKKNLAGISASDMMDQKVTIAYEPIWAIGTGKVATPEIAQSVHATIREILANLFDDDVGQNTRILYGGSVSPDSIDGLMAQPDIDGALVGGASLDATKFGRVINFEEAAVLV